MSGAAFVAQRGRGVYLVRCEEYENGVEEYEAFSTAAAALRWAAEWFGQPLKWEHTPGGRGRWATWSATVDESEGPR